MEFNRTYTVTFAGAHANANMALLKTAKARVSVPNLLRGLRKMGTDPGGFSNSPTLDGLSNFSYDLRSQSTLADHTLPGVDENFTLDDNGNRTRRTKLDLDGPGSIVATNMFFPGYDGINPTLAFNGTTTTDVSNRFLWGPMVDQLFCR